ncbi:Ada metal-binding domain-containing protein [Gordonia westfalica]|uniref:DNA-3-methyladenine glycosylase II n=1 Tax=Gordonia westfalica TaxID=158898 RepID=A0ABU2GSB3_9ACTN|nr:AlkA N-terminal domain-containing protein [Gordonia westfalica]MDS1114354.1 Ada metal-binding domain-containing protein [Gordonia westfalica]
MTTASVEQAVPGSAPDFDRCYRAVKARDARFDGQFFVTVRTTGIYCRPSCPAQTPRPQNVAFVLTAAAAQQQGYRACRRCAPDAVPGSPLWNVSADMSARAMRLIADGVVEREGVAGLAARLKYSARHLNRVLTDHLGAGPLALARAHRATNARVLIQCTSLPMSDVAFAAGFASIRQFNDTIRAVFGLTPTELRRLRSRRSRPPAGEPSAPGSVTLRLPFRAPYRWQWMRWFLSAHAAAGVETIIDDPDAPLGWRFRRVIALPHGPAVAEIEPHDDNVGVALSHLDMRDLGAAVNRLRRLLDLDADITAAEETLADDPTLRTLVGTAPGLRVPGTLDADETIFRTMLGQQVSLAAARHQIDRLVDALGEPLHDSDPTDRDHVPKAFPTAAAIAAGGRDVLRGPRRRIDAVIGVAEAIADGRVEPHVGVDASDLRAQLIELPGIGPWTADIVTMRVTGDPDVLLANDLVVAKAAADLGLDLRDTHHWAPWRSYATMHLWRHRLAGAGEDV